MKKFKEHSLVFDGTSYFIVPTNEIEKDMEVVYQSNNFEELNEMVDHYNEMDTFMS